MLVHSLKTAGPLVYEAWLALLSSCMGLELGLELQTQDFMCRTEDVGYGAAGEVNQMKVLTY